MPWKESSVMDERIRFVIRLKDGESMAALCREFQISRKTGYKIFERYEECGLEGLTGVGIQADVQVGGMVMESLKAIAFDLAAMLMSIEGRSVVPAFLVHDSPREADLGVSIYHRWFRFIASLEKLSTEALFQYIITTTSEPPQELRSSGSVVEILHGAQPAERLLRRELR